MQTVLVAQLLLKVTLSSFREKRNFIPGTIWKLGLWNRTTGKNTLLPVGRLSALLNTFFSSDYATVSDCATVFDSLIFHFFFCSIIIRGKAEIRGREPQQLWSRKTTLTGPGILNGHFRPKQEKLELCLVKVFSHGINLYPAWQDLQVFPTRLNCSCRRRYFHHEEELAWEATGAFTLQNIIYGGKGIWTGKEAKCRVFSLCSVHYGEGAHWRLSSCPLPSPALPVSLWFAWTATDKLPTPQNLACVTGGH